MDNSEIYKIKSDKFPFGFQRHVHRFSAKDDPLLAVFLFFVWLSLELYFELRNASKSGVSRNHEIKNYLTCRMCLEISVDNI